MAEHEKSLTRDEEISLTADLESAEDLEDDTAPVKARGKRRVMSVPADISTDVSNGDNGPPMTSVDWPAFVTKHFAEDELDKDGNPMVHGLRRITRLLLGPILESRAIPIQAPQYVPGLEKVGVLQPTTVAFHVKILMCRDVPAGMAAYEVVFEDVADVYFGNTDADFARHASASASTKAEARCLRKALQLRGVAAEEKTVVPEFEASQNGLITPSSVNFLDVLGRRNDINIMKYINLGKTQYQSVWEVPTGTATKMIEHLDTLQRDPAKVPPGVKGFVEGWQTK